MAYLFYHEKEGCTRQNIKNMDLLLDAAHFNAVYTHMGIKVVPGTSAQILTEKEQIDRDIAALQSGSIYIYCVMDDEPSEIRKSAFYKRLLVKSEEGLLFRAPIKLEFLKEREIHGFPLPVKKDITFVSTDYETEIGWYNVRAGILWISDLCHYPDRFSNLLKSVLETILQFRRTGKIALPKLTLGADPEFEIISKDESQLVPANTFFKTGSQHQLGCDGHSATGELRPEPSRNPIGLLRNTKRLVRKLARFEGFSNKVKVCAGGGIQVNLGGHLHFNVEGDPKKLCGILHDLLGIQLLEAQTSRVRGDISPLTSKGGSDSFRTNEHGFEWRSPPSWLTSEEITKAVYCTAYCVVRAHQLQQLQLFPDKKKTLRELPLYKFYKDEIESFIELFYNGKVKKLEGIDIREQWDVPRSAKDFTVRIISADNIVKEYFKPVITDLKNSVTIRIDFGGTDIETFGVPEDIRATIDEIGDKHYITASHFEFQSSREMVDAWISLPAAWQKARLKNEACKEFRKVIKALALELGNK